VKIDIIAALFQAHASVYKRHVLPITRRRLSDFGLSGPLGQAKKPHLFFANLATLARDHLCALVVKDLRSKTPTSLINSLHSPNKTSIRMPTSTRESILSGTIRTKAIHPSKGFSWPQQKDRPSTSSLTLHLGPVFLSFDASIS
jgi:hypothetical protein